MMLSEVAVRIQLHVDFSVIGSESASQPKEHTCQSLSPQFSTCRLFNKPKIIICSVGFSLDQLRLFVTATC